MHGILEVYRVRNKGRLQKVDLTGPFGPLKEEEEKKVMSVRVFYLDRLEDESGISGTGRVAIGVVFPDGVCALNWLTDHGSTAIYPGVEDLEDAHCQDGSARLVWATS